MKNKSPEKFRELKRQQHAFTALTAYSYPFARLLDDTELDVLLVGDSLAMVEMGQTDTVDTTLDEMLHHVKMVRRAVTRTLLVADLPSLSYETPEMAERTARLLIEAGAEAVKLEGGVEKQAVIEHLTGLGIPVMAHIGMLPQHIREEGRYRIKGKTPEEQELIQTDARAVEEAGAFSVVMELVHPPLSREISDLLQIPTIGIGSGPECDGQILVTYDLIGLSPWFKPRFVEPKAAVAGEIQRAVSEFIADTRAAKGLK